MFSIRDVQEEAEDNKTDADLAKKIWSQTKFAAEYRKFNIDMTPKVNFL